MIAGLGIALSLGCYPHRGLPTRYGPEALAERAVEACYRRDPLAFEALATRFIAHHPRDERATTFAAALRSEEPCLELERDAIELEDGRAETPSCRSCRAP